MNSRSYTSNNKVTLVKNGEDFINANLELIEQAKNFIWLHTYIYEDDDTTRLITEALKKKAREGVKVYMLVDGFGSRSLSASFIDDLMFAGVEFAWFSPLFILRPSHFGRRLHSKMLLIDNIKVITGGINHAQRFIAPKGEKPWLDYSVLLEGEEVFEFTLQNFKLYSKNFKSINKLKSLYFYVPMNLPASHCLVRLLKNDWMRLKNHIYKSHLNSIRNAKERIIIMATYFFPGKKLLNELKMASKNGVEIILIFTERSDHTLEKWSSRYLYSWYLRHNFQIYEWSQSIVHGKVILFDDKQVSIGSYNHNFMSRYGNIELNLDILDFNFNQKVLLELTRVINACNVISLDRWEDAHHLGHRLKEIISYLFANFLSLVAVWFTVRKSDGDDLSFFDH